MKLILVGFAALLLVGALALIVALLLGSRLPLEHRVSVARELNGDCEQIYATIADVAAQPQWRRGLRRVTMLPPGPGGELRYVEERGRDRLTLLVEEAQPHARWVSRIDDDTLPFGGRWVLELRAAPRGCQLTITEDGVVKPAFFRFVMHYLLGEERTLRQYLDDLAKRLDQNVRPK